MVDRSFQIDPQLLAIARVKLEDAPDALQALIDRLQADTEQGDKLREHVINLRAMHAADIFSGDTALREDLIQLVDFWKKAYPHLSELNASGGESRPSTHTTENQATSPARCAADWQLHKPKRFQGYSEPLYQFLKSAHDVGKPCPTARDVLVAWLKDCPPEVVEVKPNLSGIIYHSGGARAEKPADVEAITKTIRRMTAAD